MKLMIVGSDKVFAIENYYVKYIRKAGIDVEAFNGQSIFYDFYQRNYLNKILFKSGLSGILKTINDSFKIHVEKYKPDIIWVFKGMEIFPASLRWARSRNIKLVSYNPDNPFLFAGSGSGNRFVTESIGLYDLHFTYNLAIERQLKNEYNADTFFLPFGFDLTEKVYDSCKEVTEVLRSCFLGNPDVNRAAFIRGLAEQGVEIDVYGNKWNKFVRHKNIVAHDPVYGDDLWKVLRTYRVQLNLMRMHNLDSHNMRSFEVPGIGGIMVAPDTSEHRLFFEDGKEVFLFRDIRSCAEKIGVLLSLHEADALQIRLNARNRSISSGYKYEDRAKYALERIKSIYV